MAQRKSPKSGKPGNRPAGHSKPKPQNRSSAAKRGHPPHAAPKAPPGSEDEGPVWLWGGHAALAALANPRRHCRRVILAGETVETWEPQVAELLEGRSDVRKPDIIARHEFDRVLPGGAVHQGLAVEAAPLQQPALETLLDAIPDDTPSAMLLLDQVTDPHNVGAILRSAAAFGAAAVVTTWRNAPPETGTLAKTASGALEHVPYLRLTNLARAMETLKTRSFHLLGLAGEAELELSEAADIDRVALVLGAEGHGLRQKTRTTCDQLVRLPTQGAIQELNVSNAAAVTLYELIGRKHG